MLRLFLKQLGNMKKPFIRVNPEDYIQVSPEDFNYSDLRLAAIEGRLFVTPRVLSDEQLREQAIQSILEYVGRIRDCASAEYQDTIGDIWRRMLCDDTTSRLFFFERNVGQKGKPNFYRVNAVVFILREHGVYRKEEFTATALHCLLENSPKRTNVYMGANKYFPSSEERRAILELFKLPR